MCFFVCFIYLVHFCYDVFICLCVSTAGLDIGPLADNSPVAPQSQPGRRTPRAIAEEPLDGILSPELDKMVTDGQCARTFVFKLVLSPAVLHDRVTSDKEPATETKSKKEQGWPHMGMSLEGLICICFHAFKYLRALSELLFIGQSYASLKMTASPTGNWVLQFKTLSNLWKSGKHMCSEILKSNLAWNNHPQVKFSGKRCNTTRIPPMFYCVWVWSECTKWGVACVTWVGWVIRGPEM